LDTVHFSSKQGSIFHSNRIHFFAVLHAVTQQMAVAMARHPFRARKMTVERATSAIRRRVDLRLGQALYSSSSVAISWRYRLLPLY
jgi:hypothetical protein